MTLHFESYLLMVIHFGFLANVKTTFLCWDLEDEIYVEYPQHLSDVGKDDCIILNKFRQY